MKGCSSCVLELAKSAGNQLQKQQQNWKQFRPVHLPVQNAPDVCENPSAVDHLCTLPRTAIKVLLAVCQCS